MKTSLTSKKNLQGSILMVTVTLSFIIGIVLLSCLSLVKSQNQSVARSQAWNAAMPVAEAGVEEAMAHLNNQRQKSLAVDGWTQSGNVYARKRLLGTDFYTTHITVTNTKRPVIVSTGYVRAPALVADSGRTVLASAGINVGGVAYIARAVRVTTQRQPLFSKAMLAKQQIDMKGNPILTDSFDSTDPLRSTTNGMWDPATAGDKGDVATLSSLENSLGVGNADIKGKLQTGAGGTVYIGPNGVVGSTSWHDGGNTGLEDGWWTDDLNIYIPDVQRPFVGGGFTPTSGSITGEVYKYVLGNGNYELPVLDVKSKEKIAITGDAVLLVNGDTKISGNIDIMPGASLKLYVAGANTDISGKLVNDSQAIDFQYYGLPTNTSVAMASNGDFNGVIYAPSAHLVLTGGGSTTFHMSGSVIVNTIKINGHYHFHYDESLAKADIWGFFVIDSWTEI